MLLRECLRWALGTFHILPVFSANFLPIYVVAPWEKEVISGRVQGLS